MPTGKEICEVIVKAIKLENPDSKITPREVWEISNTGELWPVVGLYNWAKNRLSGEDE